MTLIRAALSVTVIAALAMPVVVSAACSAGQVEDPATGICGPALTEPGGSSGSSSSSSAGSGSGGGSSTILLNPIGGTATNPSGVSSVPVLLGNVLRALFGVLGSIALLMFIYGGFVWLTSGGNPDNIKKGKDTMVWAVLGLAVIFTSYALVAFVIDRLTAV